MRGIQSPWEPLTLESDCLPALEQSEEVTAAVGLSAIGRGCLPAVEQRANCSGALGVLAGRCQKPVLLARDD